MRELVIVFVLAAFLPLHAQESASKTGLSLYTYFDGLLNDTLHDPAKPKLINYPTIAYSPETRWELGVSSLYIYSAQNDLSNRLSELKAFTFYTLENQYGLWLDHAVYTDENLWFFYGKVRYQSFPLFYYGGRARFAKRIHRLNRRKLYLGERTLLACSNSFVICWFGTGLPASW